MDASQTATADVDAPNDVEMSQISTEHVDGVPPTEEQPPSQPQPTAANPKPKRALKAAPNADRPPGKSLLPISRVQKIMKADKELPTCAKEAVFLISVATEEFIKRLGQAGQQQAMREKRTTVQRRDVATAVRRADEFVFLEEILAAGIPGVAPAEPVKRKAKAPALVNDNMNLKEAFGKGKGKEKATTDSNASMRGGKGDGVEEAPEKSQDPPERPAPSSATEESQSTQIEREGKEGDEMDVS